MARRSAAACAGRGAFDLIDRLAHEGRAPEPSPGPLRGTDGSKVAVHNYEDRGPQEVITHEELFLGHFPTSARHVRGQVEIAGEQVASATSPSGCCRCRRQRLSPRPSAA